MDDPIKSKDRAWYLKELQSNECLCDLGKQPGRSFCYSCYRQLPPEMQRALYRQIGQGYEEAFEEAALWLSEEVW